ncbi:MAG: aminomethyl-transferring glycine dehydrogenase subunit GcvPB [Planctomycetota bacterium]
MSATPESPLIFDRSRRGRQGVTVPQPGVPASRPEEQLPRGIVRGEIEGFPEVSELDVVRHYTTLSRLNVGIDTTFYPLGSCTMKYNPRVNEAAAALGGFSHTHPYQDEQEIQGHLCIFHELERFLGEISGLPHVTLQPAAGAHGELTGLMLIRAFHHDHSPQKNVILIPDSAHGTNPASCTMNGFRTREVKSSRAGTIELEDFRSKLDDDVAGMMITNPNTLGIFESDIGTITRELHEAGALAYMDGANMNAILGITRPGDTGVDVMHYNLHKTFSTPHGGGGPGAGPVAVCEKLEPYLPAPRVVKAGESYRWDHDRPASIGKVKPFHGNVGMLVRAYAYIRGHGPQTLRRVAEMAVLNANYLRALLEEHYHLPYKTRTLHEVVFTAKRQKERGVSALDIAKALIDHGFHPPTIYFPLVVNEALMIEPTETESKETLDAFAGAMIAIDRESQEHPERLHEAPVTAPVKRLDEVRAVKQPDLRWTPGSD